MIQCTPARRRYLSVASFCAAIAALCCIFPPSVQSQHVSTEYALTFDPSNSELENGGWNRSRVDANARMTGEAGLEASGQIQVRGAAYPDFETNANKLEYAGVVAVRENPQLAGSELISVIGAKWGYERPIIEAMRNLSAEIPKATTTSAKWPVSDRALYEMGRPAIRFIEVKTKLEAAIREANRTVFDRAILQYCVSRPPAVIPQRPADLDEYRPFNVTQEATAVYRLGPSVLPMLDQIEAEAQANGTLTESVRNWIAFLRTELKRIRSSIFVCLNGNESGQSELFEIPFPGLQRGRVLSEDRIEDWPIAEQILVTEMRLGALRTLEDLRAAKYDYATKADWAIGKIRQRVAIDFINFLHRYATAITQADADAGVKPDPEERLKNYFGQPTNKTGNPFNGARNIGDFVLMMLCADQIYAEAGHVEDTAKALMAGADEDEIARQMVWVKVCQYIRSQIDIHVDQSRGLTVADRVKEIRNNPDRAKALLERLKGDFNSLTYTAFSEVEVQRAKAAAIQAKFNWMHQQILARDQEAALDLFLKESQSYAEQNDLDIRQTDIMELRRTGVIRIDEAWLRARRMSLQDINVLDRNGVVKPITGEKTWLFLGDPDYRVLYSLNADEFAMLLDPKKGYIEVPGKRPFRGDKENAGQIYDFQHSLKNKGLSIDMLLPDDRAPVFELQPGRSYEFTYEYMSDGMASENSWIRFIPLDKNGRPLMTDYVPEDDPDVQQGRIVPFRWAHDAGADELQSRRKTGSTYGEWKRFRIFMGTVPDEIHGFTLEVKLDKLTGSGEFYYRNFKLSLSQSYFRENFEPKGYDGEAAALPSLPSKEDFLPDENWERVIDTANRYMPYSRLTYNTLVLPEGGQQRSLLIEPNGYNVRLETRKFFELDTQKGYAFHAAIMAKRMHGARAYFEILLYDEDKNPVNIDGMRVVEGQNVIRTATRGDSLTTVGWEQVSAYEGWYQETLQLDNRRIAQIEKRFDDRLLSALDDELFAIRYARIAIVVEGDQPAYDAQVYIDNLELKEYPKVTMGLGHVIAPEGPQGLQADLSEWEREGFDGTLVRYKFPEDGRPTRRFISFDVEGLQPRRLGYSYSIRLYDYLGEEIQAADSLGAEKLDKVVLSDENGNLRSRYRIPRIYFDELGLKDRFGYFIADFELRYAGDEKPLVSRRFLFGFVPPPLDGEIDPGDLGIVVDHNSEMQQGMLRALKMLGVGKIGIPLFRRGGTDIASQYSRERWVSDYRRISRLLPGVNKIALFDEIPPSMASITAEGGASPIISNPSREDWKEWLREVHNEWDETFSSYVAGAADERSYTAFSGDAARALDNLEGEFATNRQQWAQRELPVELAREDELLDRVDALVKSFRSRWRPALDAQKPEITQAITDQLAIEEMQRLRAATPDQIWLKRKERMSFYVPASLSAQEMRSAVNEVLGKLGRFEDVLGEDATTATQNAQVIAQGDAADFSGYAAELRDPVEHTIFIDLQTVNPKTGVTFVDQLRDLTEKVVLAKEMGFERILISRLRNTADLPNGLLTRFNDPQPAFFAIRTLNSLLSYRERVPLKLDLRSGADNAFFRKKDGKNLTVIVFPTDEDVIEELPLGNNVKRVDLMGNLVDVFPIRERRDGQEIATGMVRLEMKANGMPIILTGVDTSLLSTISSLQLDDNQLRSERIDQLRSFTLTNSFDVPASFSLQIPLLQGDGDRTNIADAIHFKRADGRELPPLAPRFTFNTVELQPGESRVFRLQMRPRRSMSVGPRVLPVKIDIRARDVYSVTHRLAVDVRSNIDVSEGTLMQPRDLPVIDAVLTVNNRTNAARNMTSIIYFADLPSAQPREKEVSVPANGTTKVTISSRRFDNEDIIGTRVQVGLRESSGTLFYNQDFVVEREEATGRILLVPAEE